MHQNGESEDMCSRFQPHGIQQGVADDPLILFRNDIATQCSELGNFGGE
jgi:hypothetical protein